MNYNLSINENLNRILTTKKGSLVLNPNYGLNYDWLDKPLTSQLKQEIQEDIINQITTYEPRLSIQEIQISQIDSKISVSINSSYKIDI